MRVSLGEARRKDEKHTPSRWGNAAYGGRCLPADAIDETRLLTSTRVKYVYSTATAFAAVSYDQGRLYAWGDSANGGDIGNDTAGGFGEFLNDCFGDHQLFIYVNLTYIVTSS